MFFVYVFFSFEGSFCFFVSSKSLSVKEVRGFFVVRIFDCLGGDFVCFVYRYLVVREVWGSGRVWVDDMFVFGGFVCWSFGIYVCLGVVYVV